MSGLEIIAQFSIAYLAGLFSALVIGFLTAAVNYFRN